MLQFDLQFYEELTVARVKTVKFISGAFFWPTGQLVYYYYYFFFEGADVPVQSSLVGAMHEFYYTKECSNISEAVLPMV